MRKPFFIILGLCCAALLMLGGIMMWAESYYQKAGPLVQETKLVIERGMGLSQITRRLNEKQIIDQPLAFRVMVRLKDAHLSLKAGEYEFPALISPQDVVQKLLSHDVVKYYVTIPEGLTSIEILDLISATNDLKGVINEYPPDGSLLPETYQYARGDTRASIIMRMRRAMDKFHEKVWVTREDGLPVKSWSEAVVLASIVEKETALAKERPLVASVFINRLRKPMRLQSDPTVVYALNNGKGKLGRALTRKDWKYDHPFNTYMIKGLPPGAIANPGRQSILAVLRPVKSDALYFVADGKGGHAFAKTLKQHNRNVAKWRKIKKQAAQ